MKTVISQIGLSFQCYVLRKSFYKFCTYSVEHLHWNISIDPKNSQPPCKSNVVMRCVRRFICSRLKAALGRPVHLFRTWPLLGSRQLKKRCLCDMLPFGILILYLSTTEILKHEYLKMKKSHKSESFHLLFLHRNNNSSCIFLSNNRHSLELRSQYTDSVKRS